MKKIASIVSGLLMLSLAATTANALQPWFTGPILAPAGKTIPKGHWDFEPYVFYTDSFAIYDSHRRVVKVPDTHTLNFNPLVFYGLTDWMDFQGSFPLNHNVKNQQSGNGVGDIALTLGFQFMDEQAGTIKPALRVTIGQSFPTGKYENLNPVRQGTDSNGSGSYQTVLAANFQKMVQLANEHNLRGRLSFSYTFAQSTSVRGFNSYGGGFGTNGRIRPGNQFQADFALEYQLTQNWVPVFEVNYNTVNRSHFTGMPGLTPAGTVATVGHGETDQLSFAPALEYNFNENAGLIGGVWFSAKGRNASDFVSGVVAFNYFVA